MRLHPNWRTILTTAWSARLALLLAALSAADSAFTYFVDGSLSKAILAFVGSVAIGFSRVIVQEELHPED